MGEMHFKLLSNELSAHSLSVNRIPLEFWNINMAPPQRNMWFEPCNASGEHHKCAFEFIIQHQDFKIIQMKKKMCNYGWWWTLTRRGDYFATYTNIKSLYCIRANNIMLYVNYTSIKSLKIFKKVRLHMYSPNLNCWKQRFKRIANFIF